MTIDVEEKPELFGVLAEFADPESLVAASRQAYDAGLRRFEAYAPFPVAGLAEAIGFHRPGLPLLVLVGGMLGATVGYGFQYWVSVVDYPLNIGGRPLHSWPSFIPVTFEMTILGAALSAVLGMLALNGLPRPYHPLFGIERFRRVTRDGFFLCVLSTDPQFDAPSVRSWLVELGAREVTDVPW